MAIIKALITLFDLEIKINVRRGIKIKIVFLVPGAKPPNSRVEFFHTPSP